MAMLRKYVKSKMGSQDSIVIVLMEVNFNNHILDLKMLLIVLNILWPEL